MQDALITAPVIAAIEAARRVVPGLRVVPARDTRGHDWVASPDRGVLWVAEGLPPDRRSGAVLAGLAALTAGRPRLRLVHGSGTARVLAGAVG